MKRFFITVAVLGAVGWGLWKGFKYFSSQADLLMDYCYNYVKAEVFSMNKEKVSMRLTFEIKNKSNIDVTIDSYDFDIRFNGLLVSKATANTAQELVHGGLSQFYVDVDFSPKKVFKGVANIEFLASLSFDLKKIMIGTSGTVAVSHKGIKLAKGLPIDFTMSVADMIPSGPSEKCV